MEVLCIGILKNPHSFSLLDPDKEGKKWKITTEKNAKKSVPLKGTCNFLFLKIIKSIWTSSVFYTFEHFFILFLFFPTTVQQNFYFVFFYFILKLDPDPHGKSCWIRICIEKAAGSGLALSKTAGSGSAKNEYRSTALGGGER